MTRYRTWFLVLLLCPHCAFSQRRALRDTPLTDVSAPQPQYRVIPDDQRERIATQEEAMRDIRDRLARIEGDVKEIKGDVTVLKDTNTVVKFLVSCFTILVPGLVIAGFGVWFANHLKRSKHHNTTKLGSVGS